MSTTIHKFSIDFGTSTLSACYATGLSNGSVDERDVRLIPFPNEFDDFMVPMLAAWHDSEFRFGHKVDNDMERDPVPRGKIIRGFKLLMYGQYRTTTQTEHVSRQIREAGKEVKELFVAVLEQIWSQMKSFAQGQGFRGDLPPEQVHIYVAVPMLPSPGAMNMLAAAAKEAGMPSMQCVAEPMCAGVSIVRALLASSEETEYQKYRGSGVMVLDVGGGTTDTITVRLPDNLDDALRNKMEVISQADSLMLGSTDIDESFQEWLRRDIDSREPGGLEGLCSRLYLEQEELFAMALNHFQTFKEAHPRAPKTGRLFTLYNPTQGGTMEFILEKQTVDDFFEPHLRAICNFAIGKITSDTKVIIPVGGFGSSEHFFREFQSRLSRDGVEVIRAGLKYHECPVARGAMMTDLLDNSKRRSRLSVGIVMYDEPLDRDHHPDVFGPRGGKNHKLIFYDRNARDREVVYDRIQWLLFKGAPSDPEEPLFNTSEHVVQTFHIDHKGPKTMRFRIVFSSKDSPVQHEPLFDADGNVRDDFQFYEETMTLPEAYVRRLEELKWIKKVQEKDREKRWRVVNVLEIFCAVRLRYNDFFIHMTKKLVKPESLKHIENVDNWLQKIRLSYDEADWEEIWDSRFDHQIVNPSQQPNPPSAVCEISSSSVGVRSHGVTRKTTVSAGRSQDVETFDGTGSDTHLRLAKPSQRDPIPSTHESSPFNTLTRRSNTLSSASYNGSRNQPGQQAMPRLKRRQNLEDIQQNIRSSPHKTPRVSYRVPVEDEIFDVEEDAKVEVAD